MSAGAPARSGAGSSADPTPHGAPLTAAALSAWSLLSVLQLGWLSFAYYQWGFAFWRYLEPVPAAALAAAAFVACWPGPRRRGAAALERGLAALARWPRAGLALAGFVAVTALFWWSREQVLYGDSGVMLVSFRTDRVVVFPEVGATWLIGHAIALGKSLQLGVMPAVRGLSCLGGGAAALLLVWIFRTLLPDRTAPFWAALLVLSGGLGRVFAGHIEVYSTSLVGVLLYLGASLAWLSSGRRWWLVPLALGVALWLHASAACLLPSLLVLHWLGRPGLAPGRRLREAGPALLGCALPLVAFAALRWATGHGDEVLRIGSRIVEILGGSSDPGATRWWVRGWGGAPSIGSDVVFLSRPQLKYLLNAFWVLSPFAIPSLAWWAARRGRGGADPAAVFLAWAAAPLVVYAFLLRPFWGPFDWDLFSPTALCLAILAAYGLASRLDAGRFREVAFVAVAFQLCFVTLPFAVVGGGEARAAGPFVGGPWSVELSRPATPWPDPLARWL